jgi:hypothetical protein
MSAALLATLAFYGSWLPLRKSALLNEAVGQLRTVNNPADLITLLSVPLDAPSPIGQGETMRDVAGVVLTILNMPHEPERNPAVVSAVVAFVEFVTDRFAPILTRGKGVAFHQTLYTMGAINAVAYLDTGEPAYLDEAEKLFTTGLGASPNRPEYLHGLLDVYRMRGDARSTRTLARRILELWPEDRFARSALAELPEDVKEQ